MSPANSFLDSALTGNLDSREDEVSARKVGRRRIRDADSVRIVRVVVDIKHKVCTADDAVDGQLCVYGSVAEFVAPVYREFLGAVSGIVETSAPIEASTFPSCEGIQHAASRALVVLFNP